MRGRQKHAKRIGILRESRLKGQPGNRAVRIEQITVALMDTADFVENLPVVISEADDVASKRCQIALVERLDALEVAGRTDVHRVGDRGNRRTRFVLS